MLSVLFAITLFGYSWLFILAIIIFLFFLFVSEVEGEGGISLTALVVLSVLLFWKGDGYTETPINDYLTWGNLFIYLALGLVYSLFRIYLLSRNYKITSTQTRESALSDIKYYALRNFTRWILQFPISLISFVFTDVLSHLKERVTQLFSGVIDSILNLGLKSNESLAKKEAKEAKKAKSHGSTTTIE